MASNHHVDAVLKIDWETRLTTIANFFWTAATELYYGLKTNSIPWAECFATGTAAILSVQFHFDYLILQRLQISSLYPTSLKFQIVYRLFTIASPFLLWCVYKAVLHLKQKKKLEEIFLTGGLKTATGRIPQITCDIPIDGFTRKIQFNRAIFPLKHFEKAKELLESGLRVYVDEFKENREKGLVEAVYSKFPMPKHIDLKEVSKIPELSFCVGSTRTKEIIINLNEVPHLLVAGQTGGGKSTFLRQLISTLYLRNSFELSLIDLKGGLEFQLFEGLPRVKVISTIERAVERVKKLSGMLDERMDFLRAKKCKDIEAYLKLKQVNETAGDAKCKTYEDFRRYIIVVDEAAELFLVGSHAKSKDIQDARKVLSKIARQGRSVGVHIIIATQRPDSRALDPQIKANLPGKLCFQMGDDASSISVLGNGRATDLPPIPGRAIWKTSVTQIEIQTPFISDNDVETLLQDVKEKEQKSEL